jgi:putative DNA methylase
MMTKPYKKKLIEVAIPLEAISAGSSYEKMPGIGAHPRGIHHWWARRPHVACRSFLFAQLVDDPSSHPEKFSTDEKIQAERNRLFEIIERLSDWKNSQDTELLRDARAEIQKSCDGSLPSIYDPFSGGFSIASEAQRLGLPAFGSDLNPVSVVIGKAMVEIPPRFKASEPIHPGPKDRNHYRHAEGLAEDVTYYGEWLRQRAVERIGHLYPTVRLPQNLGGNEVGVIAWIWARTVPSPDPAFSDVKVPIASNFILSTKKGKESWIALEVDKRLKTIQYKICKGGTKTQLDQAKEGTKVGRANFVCPMSGTAITPQYVKECGAKGELGQTLMAIVAEGKGGRVYLPPSQVHEDVAFSETPIWKPELEFFQQGLGFRVGNYGMSKWSDLFTQRQLVALNALTELIGEARARVEADALGAGMDNSGISLREGGSGAKAYAEAISIYLAFGVDRAADFNNSLVRWSPSNEKVMNLFGRQAIPMVWDFAEANILADVVGGFAPATAYQANCLSRLVTDTPGVAWQNDAQTVSYGENAVISTDPPYYDNIGYADLSDFFYVWLRRSIGHLYPDLFSTIQTPKSEELVATPARHGGGKAAEEFFLDGMTKAMASMAKQVSPHYPITIYYAFKQSEIEQDGISSTGWATFIQAIIDAGMDIRATWPVRSEQSSRIRGIGSNALASSVVLVCRKRQEGAENVTRAEFIRALKRELPAAIAELQAANIAPADMPQSAIGPGMGVFSRYKAVLESDDRPMSVKAALQLINRELDEYLGGIQGEFDADTRFAITWFEQHGMAKGDYGTANNIATARGISVESVKHAGIVESAAGKVRILCRDELADTWEPSDDSHLTVWECLQHLVKKHEKDGISHDTAVLLKKIETKAEAVKDLAYCLYDISANKRKDAKEATAYNALIADWTELTRQAAAIHDTSGDRQIRLDI